jgi:hypothetical protein
VSPEDDELIGPIPGKLEELPAGTRIWLGSLTPEKLKRLKQLDRLADEVDPVRIKELVSIAEKAETLRRAGQWIVAGLFVLLIAGASIIDAVERIWGWIKAAPKG